MYDYEDEFDVEEEYGPHDEIRIPFEIAGIRFVAVGFLTRPEDSIPAIEACDRMTARVVDDLEHFELIEHYRLELPPFLFDFTTLVTKVVPPDYPRSFMYLGGDDHRGWHRSWFTTGHHLGRNALVLCLDE